MQIFGAVAKCQSSAAVRWHSKKQFKQKTFHICMLWTNEVNGVTRFPAGIHAKALKTMERETGFEPATSSLGSRYAIENKDQMRPRLCILTTATHREINACPEKLENGVNGVKPRTSFLTPLRRQSEPSSGSPNRAVCDSAGGYPCHVLIRLRNTNITRLGIYKESRRYSRKLIRASSSRSDERGRLSGSSASGSIARAPGPDRYSDAFDELCVIR